MSGHPSVEELEAMPAEVAAHVAQCEVCAREVAWLRAERAMLSRRPSPPVHQLWAGIAARVGAAAAAGEAAAEAEAEASGLRLQASGEAAAGSGLQASGRQGSGGRARWARRLAFSAAAFGAAAAVFLVLLPRTAPVAGQVGVGRAFAPREEFRPDPRALAALDRAELDYRDAARVLEAEYDRLRPQLDPALAKRWDETLSRAHTQLGEARKVAGDDVNARMQVLDGYAGYLRSLRNVVLQSEEANP